MTLTQLGRYQIVSELGRGAMGVVYKAVDPAIDRLVAIKTVSLALPKDELEEYQARFSQEAKAAGRLNHPNVVTVYDVGKTENVAYMAMEFLEGQELKALLAHRQPLPVTQAVDIAAQVADGLAYAHEHHIVHRDVKPANIMIVRGGLVKILDFGIARMRTSDVKTLTGMVLGSPKYMSPEQVTGKRADARSDIFSLGVVLYEMLTGSAPFEGESIHTIMFQTLNLAPNPPSSFNPAVPRMLDYVVAKALAKNPEDRYQHAKDMAADLRECRRLMEISAPSPPAGTGGPAPGSPARPYALPAMTSWALDPGEDSAATYGLSKIFDSSEATLRLAALTGMEADLQDYAATLKLTPARAQEAKATPPLAAQAGPGKNRARAQRRWPWILAAALLLVLLLLFAR